jgi:hypothetical protein
MPRQRCGPAPNARWRLSARPISKRSVWPKDVFSEEL